MLVIGLTGGVASGKTTVSNILKSLGVILINADLIGHRTYEKGTDCYHKLIEQFGNTIVAENGEINRRRLGDLVFSDKSKMNELTGIVWPAIRKMLIKELDDIRSTVKAGDSPPIVALEAAVMIEAGWTDLVSTLWVIHMDRDVAKGLLMTRNNLSTEEASKRIDSQMSNEERCKQASHILYNNGSLDQLEAETHRLFRDLTGPGK
jgi:dephospho-CoA kinase